ncbi:MAG: FadR/GntR family transcriptional regulator [Oscillospiraceae bacterium]
MTKEKETENRSERERFLDRMLKEILSGQRSPGDRLPTESELAEQYGLRKTNVHLGLQELERLGFLRVVPRHATYVAPYWEQANLETLAAIMTHGGKPKPELVDAFLELREMVALGWFRWMSRNPKTEQMRHLYGLLERMEAIAYAPDGEKDKPEFLDLVNQFLVCMFAESDNMIFRVLLRSSRELAHVTLHRGVHAGHARAVQDVPHGARRADKWARIGGDRLLVRLERQGHGTVPRGPAAARK